MIKGMSVAYCVIGGLILYSGIKGATIADTVRGVLKGDLTLGTTEVIKGTPTATTSATSTAPLGVSSIPATGYAYVPNNPTANAVILGRYLTSQGFSKAAAAGIAGCVAGESVPPFNPESVGSGGFGLIGWTGNTIGLPGGYTGPTGNVQADWSSQLAGIVGYVNAVGSIKDMNDHAPDPVTAANHFSDTYEKPAVFHSDVRASVALAVYGSL